MIGLWHRWFDSREHRLALAAVRQELRDAHDQIGRLTDSVGFWKAKAEERATEKRIQAEECEREVRMLSNALDQRIVPMPSSPAPAPDLRAALYRLEDECARLRDELARCGKEHR